MNIVEITEQYMLLLENNMNDLIATKKFIRDKQKIDLEYSTKIRQICQIEKKEKKEDGFELGLTNMLMTSTLQCLTLTENLNENLKEGIHVSLKKYSDVYEQRLKKINEITSTVMEMVNASDLLRETEKAGYTEEFERCTQLKSKQRKQEEKAVITSKFKNYLSSTQTLKLLNTEKLEMLNARNRYYLASLYHQGVLNQSKIEFFPFYVKQLEVIHDDFIDNRKYFSDNILESQIMHLDETSTILKKIKDTPSLMDDPSVLVRLFLDIPSKEAVGKINARYLDVADLKELCKVNDADIYDFGLNAFSPAAFLMLENIYSKAQTIHKEISVKLTGQTRNIDIGQKKFLGLKEVEFYKLVNDNELDQLHTICKKMIDIAVLHGYELQADELEKFFNTKDMMPDKPSEWHAFEDCHFKKIVECQGCKAKLWGRGLKCKHCRTNIHTKCETKAENNCEEMRKKVMSTADSEEFTAATRSEMSSNTLGKLELAVSEEFLSKFAYAKVDIEVENGNTF
eukprot:NODE_18_length_40692_cov_0.469183.p7 type:complete len:512 gc:universal NODE_18_length_40692_cov_0.469183:38024-39559(+)